MNEAKQTTRAQAIEKKTLIDVSEMAKEAGFTMPVAMTATAWADAVRWTEEDAQRTRMVQDQAGRLWDVLWTLRDAIRGGPCLAQKLNDSALIWVLYRVPTSGPRKPTRLKLKAQVGPGDMSEPVLTIQMTTEA